jgi:hypothetical protein
MGLLLLTATTLLSVLGTGAGEEARPDFAARLPAQVGQWKRAHEPARYDRKSLFDYIDGGAELYLAFGFQQAIAFEYLADKDDEIKVDVFDMGSARGAFGVFAHGRESVAAEVGQGSDYGGGLLTFWKHRWFVSVLGYPETEAKRRAVYDLAGRIAALITDTGELPEIVAALPKPGLIEASVRPFYHHLLQNDYLTISHDNPLGIGGESEAVLARYTRSGERHILMMVDYPTESAAGKAQRNFNKAVLGGPSMARHHGRWAGSKRVRNRIVVVLDAPTPLVVKQLLAEIP